MAFLIGMNVDIVIVVYDASIGCVEVCVQKGKEYSSKV